MVEPERVEVAEAERRIRIWYRDDAGRLVSAILTDARDDELRDAMPFRKGGF